MGSARDFFEKGFIFYSDGKLYRFSTSVPNAHLEGPNKEKPLCPNPNKNTVRGDVLINCGMMWRGSDGKILHTQITQCDFKLNVPSFMINSFLPKAMKNWSESVNKHYTKNNKKL